MLLLGRGEGRRKRSGLPLAGRLGMVRRKAMGLQRTLGLRRQQELRMKGPTEVALDLLGRGREQGEEPGEGRRKGRGCGISVIALVVAESLSPVVRRAILWKRNIGIILVYFDRFRCVRTCERVSC